MGRGSVTTSATRGSHSKRAILHRTLFLMVVCGGLMFVPLCWKLWDIAIVHHEEYQQKASDQQTLDFTISASRGNIYDRNNNVMAMSATVYKLILSPRDLVKSVSNKGEDGKKLPDEVYQANVAAAQSQMVEDLMTLLPDLDREKVTKQVHNTKSAYWEVKVDIEEEDKQVFQEYITEHKTASYLYLITSTKRYYPYAGLAAQALGFVNANGGAYGIEAMYNDLLEGTAGRVYTTRTAGGTERYNSYANYVDAQDGYNLTLTIDTTIQSYLEKALEEGIQEFDVRNGAFAIAMDPKTGALLGIASSPDFDPNNYSLITNDLLNDQLEANTASIYAALKENNTDNLTDSELMAKAESQARADARTTQWRSRAIDSRYEPGSTFKAMVLAAALEEGLVSESDTFYCSGSVTIPGYPKPITCSKKTGHGSQTLAEAVGNSCNPAFMEIGSRLGKDRFYDYFEAFGMLESTGVDLPGEASLVGGMWSRDKMTNVDLAVASFGQRFEVTPLQMICGFSAVINGGNLVKPYVVQTVSTQDGTVIRNTETEVVRQVVSKQTSQRAADILEQVVSKGTGKNAYVAGYRIGGKTGSSEVKTEEDRTIVSFMGYAPADDPQVIVLIAYDKPQPKAPGSNESTTGRYISGGNMAARKAGPLIAQILDYMGVERVYNSDESAVADVSMPKVTGMTLADAEKALKEKNLKYRTLGSGDTVSRQVPASGTKIPGGSTVILYLGDAVPEESGTVPDVIGKTYEEAKKALEKAGFFMRASGVSTYYSNTTTADRQSVNGGDTAAIGTVIDVRFFNQVEDGYAG
ncbi:PASTA domain-containing protein [Colidextribacter sp. OB.20]|nr:PASTA domain-containing protein [Colidextribacter sp. OB.20]